MADIRLRREGGMIAIWAVLAACALSFTYLMYRHVTLGSLVDSAQEHGVLEITARSSVTGRVTHMMWSLGNPGSIGASENLREVVRLIHPKTVFITCRATLPKEVVSSICNDGVTVEIEIMNGGEATLAELRGMECVRLLQIDSQAVIEGVTLPDLPKLDWLVLSDRQGISTLIRQISSRRYPVTFLNLSRSDVGDDDLGAVATLSMLRKLSLRDTDVTVDGLKRLAGAPCLSAVYLDQDMLGDVKQMSFRFSVSD